MTRLSKSEISIMQIIWRKGKATSFEISDEIKLREDVSEISVRTLLARLVKKKAIIISEKIGKTYVYTPLIDKQEYINYETDNFMENFYNNDAVLYMKDLFREGKLTRENVLRVQKIIEDMDDID